ncbi:MAG: type II/IV secretion system ATPase subunit [Nitrososphaerota archaeon]|nr:type II/IV secretion system ATPase subunit [Nitrososphaerota archaeon]MDG7026264.1 type II/IV secretion system ATPase subunit [Nitrososphaerota archaeon]
MVSRLARNFLSAVRKPAPAVEPPPLLLELFERPDWRGSPDPGSFPFTYRVTGEGPVPFYQVGCTLPPRMVMTLREVVRGASDDLDPGDVEPLTFTRLIDVLAQASARRIAASGISHRIRDLSELAAYEAVGLSRILALAKDIKVTEFYVDSESTPVYLDHMSFGRCESGIVLTERERKALETHLDTFSGYTLDFRTPSLKNDLVVGGAALRVSVDLEPVAVNRFALDVRRLNVSTLTLPQLIGRGLISEEAASVLVGWLEAGGNVTIVGETGTGKTTLLNALDEQVDRRLRRLYIEDAVETKDMLADGYHQVKVKVDPYDRGEVSERTKESEIVKALHRSPDIVILSEIQSEEHSRAFFQALASGARGVQTFHASTIEQAVRRWLTMHHIAEQSLLDLGILVQMARPDRLRQERYVHRVVEVTQEGGSPRIKEIYMRDRDHRLRNVAGPGWPRPPNGVLAEMLGMKVAQASARISRGGNPG